MDTRVFLVVVKDNTRAQQELSRWIEMTMMEGKLEILYARSSSGNPVKSALSLARNLENDSSHPLYIAP